jgi:hypothetical protein
MKKLFTLVGALALVAIMASTSVAQAPAATDWTKDFKTTALFQNWTVWESKYDFNNNYGASAVSTDLDRRGVSQRVNFGLEWGNTKFARGVVEFEMDSTNWGEDPYAAGSYTSGSSGRMGVAGTDQVQLEIKRAYVDFMIPSTPLKIIAGLQGFAMGGRLVQSRDIPGVRAIAMFDPHTIGLLWWRENETSRTTNQINDTYGLSYDLVTKPFNVNAYFLYKNDLRTATKDNPWWAGVGGAFRPGPLALSGQFVYVGGQKDLTATTKADYSAYAVELLATMSLTPALRLAGEFYYSSGNKADDASKINMYTRPFGSESHSNFGLGRTVIFFMNFSEFGNQHNIQSDIGGLGYLRANANLDVTKVTNLSFNYLYIRDTSSGTPGAGKRVNSVGRQDLDKDVVGHELNMITKFRLYPNMTFNVGLGYFIPGDIYDNAAKKAENAYAINTGLQLSF